MAGAREAIPPSYLEGYAAILGDVALTGRRLSRDEIAARRALGERAASEGVGLRDLVREHLIATRLAWRDLPDAAGARQVRSAAESVLAAAEQAVDALAEGYGRAQLFAVRRDEAARREFIDDLLHGRGDAGALAARAGRFGVRLAHSHAVAVARGPEPYDETHPVTRRTADALDGRFGRRLVLLTTKDGRLVCIAPGNEPEIVEYFAARVRAADPHGAWCVALGRAHPGPGGVTHSYHEALNALELADRMDLDAAVLRAADLLVFPVLTRDRQAMADLVRSVLGPLSEARGGAGPLVETLDAYFAAGCVATEAARRLSLSVRALTYRLSRIHRLTGADPADPLQRYTLQTAVIGARLLDWPARDL
ncbi:PucR family transcriptional regulator [Streptomyces litchfieldiae]|uniref:Helix-turn-helix domain-containing protein n=1 Tax=Streptomyces litchfieldiae TaxID=3075543 RepID=A0ABU2MJD5_9ACTN|nr:helix-turn-helix domain-containing protein [Streptomyces sp. DSM 44938]MDT0341547.1 helix-turn-helix domain-containing protein [Streptomyces sp. DSM 44938]